MGEQKVEPLRISTDRVLGTYGEYNGAGPTLLFLCGVHGNEPSGVQAFRKVLSTLNHQRLDFKGSLIGLAGNLHALERGVRFIDEDLNRIWSPARIKRLKETSPEDLQNVEEKEQADLLRHMEQIFSESQGPVYVIDLHTTSSLSQPFLTINDTIRNREFAQNFPFHMVLGIEEFLEGTILSYINELGHIAVGVESGQHRDPNSVAWHELAIWLALQHSGCLTEEALSPEIPDAPHVISPAQTGIYEVRYRYELTENHQFKMRPGYNNFDKVQKGQLLAENWEGEIHAPEDGEILMPLYQRLGEDGFFLVRRIKPVWLQISKWLRSRGAHRLLPYLPGIRKFQGQGHQLLVNTKIVRYFVIEFFHLLGFRRKQRMGRYMLFSRRKYDFEAPEVHR